MKHVTGIVVLLFSFPFTSVTATQEHQSHHSHYAGQHKRAIKSLSEDDIQQLRNGRGWGLAKAAELNGLPGPIHLLQMKQAIKLTNAQEQQIQALYDEMKKRAMPLGKKLIQLEKELNDSFANKSISDTQLRQKLDDIARVRSELRYTHLATHLQTPAILSPQQIKQYNELRGYN